MKKDVCSNNNGLNYSTDKHWQEETKSLDLNIEPQQMEQQAILGNLGIRSDSITTDQILSNQIVSDQETHNIDSTDIKKSYKTELNKYNKHYDESIEVHNKNRRLRDEKDELVAKDRLYKNREGEHEILQDIQTQASYTHNIIDTEISNDAPLLTKGLYDANVNLLKEAYVKMSENININTHNIWEDVYKLGIMDPKIQNETRPWKNIASQPEYTAELRRIASTVAEEYMDEMINILANNHKRTVDMYELITQNNNKLSKMAKTPKIGQNRLHY